MNTARIIEPRLLCDRPGRPPDGRERAISPLDAFRARCEARAALFAAGELDLHEPVDALQATAIRGGLLGQIGQDAVQAITAEAFGRVR
jgi:hypothetical protein